MSRQPNAYTVPMTPVTPMWGPGGSQRTRLLPSAIEMTTPPQTIQRKLPNSNGDTDSAEYTNSSLADAPSNTPADAFAASSTEPMPAFMPMGAPVVIESPLTTANTDSIVPETRFAVPANTYAASDIQGKPRYTPGRVMKQKIPSRKPVGRPYFMAQAPQDVLRNAAMPTSSVPLITQAPPPPPMVLVPQDSRSNQSHIPEQVEEPAGQAKSNLSEIRTIKDCYAAYNNYILRQATEEKSKVVWSPEVEAAFMEALWLIPGDSRKILVEQRGRGRNELIADYLHLKLNAHRTRKQVSSHLQVLKKLLAKDEEFLNIVGPRRSGEESKLSDLTKQRINRIQPDTSVTSIEQLIKNLREAKQGEPKPAFLLQAEANLEESRMQQNKVNASPMNMYNNNAVPMGYALPNGAYRDNAPLYNSQGYAADYTFHKQQPQQPQQQPQPQQQAQHLQKHQQQHYQPQQAQHQLYQQLHPEAMQKEPPLMHPRPVHAQDVDVRNREYYIPPSASVPPQDISIADTASPRRSHHHRRTTSRSVDFGGDQLLPIQFLMTRRVSENSHNAVTYTRLIRAAYSSPQNPTPLEKLLGKYPELAKLHEEGQLNGVHIVHATASLFLKPAKGAYASDVQYAIACNQPNPLQHRYLVRTVITSRNKELLRCEMPCMFQALAGRPFEQDKELINVPFLADFWADFLARLNDSSPEYTQAALLALHMYQAVYRVGADGEALCFIGLYQFNSVPDEFSARTRFRKVKSHSDSPSFASSLASSGSPRIKPESYVPLPLGVKEQEEEETPAPDETVRKEPATPTRSGNDASLAVGEQTPRPISTPMLLGMGTPGQSLGPLGTLMNYESPAIFASPRRINHLDHLDLSGLPFSSTLNNESRGSPRSNKFEIQRAMSAFEPSAWDEMQDWIYK